MAADDGALELFCFGREAGELRNSLEAAFGNTDFLHDENDAHSLRAAVEGGWNKGRAFAQGDLKIFQHPRVTRRLHDAGKRSLTIAENIRHDDHIIIAGVAARFLKSQRGERPVRVQARRFDGERGTASGQRFG